MCIFDKINSRTKSTITISSEFIIRRSVFIVSSAECFLHIRSEIYIIIFTACPCSLGNSPRDKSGCVILRGIFEITESNCFIKENFINSRYIIEDIIRRVFSIPIHIESHTRSSFIGDHLFLHLFHNIIYHSLNQ